jgi:hypothetical protein
MAGLWLLVALPGAPSKLALMVGRQKVQTVPKQNAMDRGARDLQLVKALQMVCDPSRPKVMALPQIKNLGNDLARSCPRGMVRSSWLIAQSSISMSFVSGLPLVEGLRDRPKWRQAWATFRGAALASRNTFSRQASTRFCSVFVIGSPPQ